MLILIIVLGGATGCMPMILLRYQIEQHICTWVEESLNRFFIKQNEMAVNGGYGVERIYGCVERLGGACWRGEKKSELADFFKFGEEMF